MIIIDFSYTRELSHSIIAPIIQNRASNIIIIIIIIIRTIIVTIIIIIIMTITRKISDYTVSIYDNYLL